jgi:hypothetical protein
MTRIILQILVCLFMNCSNATDREKNNTGYPPSIAALDSINLRKVDSLNVAWFYNEAKWECTAFIMIW